MADYSICKDFNPYYFNQFAGLTLIIPAFFEENSEEGKAVAVVSKRLIPAITTARSNWSKAR